MEDTLGTFQNPYFCPTQSTKGFFSDLHSENLVGFLRVLVMKVWGFPLRLGPREFLTFKLVHNQPLEVYQLPCRCFYLQLAPTGLCSCWAVILCIHLSLQFSRRQFALSLQFSDGSKKSYWFPVSSDCFLLWGEEWQFLSMLGRKPGIRTLGDYLRTTGLVRK